MSFPNKDQVEDYMKSVEEFISSSISSLSEDISGLSETIHRFWHDLSRFGPPQLPTLSDLHIPGLESIQVPPPPPPAPPLPPPPSWFMKPVDWVSRNKKLVGILGVATVGVGLVAASYGWAAISKQSRHLRPGASKARNRVIVVLGGDTPLAGPLLASLESSGFIVIATVSNADAVAELESRYHGYVRALVLDPKEPASMTYFLRSLQATLSLRFPINAAGDPYHHLTAETQPYIHSVISLLTLPSPLTTPIPTPFEHLSLTSTYISYLTQTHVTPLQAIQALLPFFRLSSAQARDFRSGSGISRSIIICVPATDARVGVPFASAQAMSAAATVRGAEVLRREIRAVSRSEDRSMEDLRVLVVDVGSLGSSNVTPEQHSAEVIENSMFQWTPSERSIYGGAFTYVLQQLLGELPKRKPQSANALVEILLFLVGKLDGAEDQRLSYRFLSKIKSGVWTWFKGERISVGAGARTYALASLLPISILDTVLQLPSLLVALQTAYLPPRTRSRRVSESSAYVHASQKLAASRGKDINSSQASLSDNEADAPTSLGTSEADVSSSIRSSVGDVSAVESSWSWDDL